MIQLELRAMYRPKGECEEAPPRQVLHMTKRYALTIAILIALLLAVGFKAAYSYRIDRDPEVLPSQRKTSGQHDRELALMKAVYLDHQRGEAIYKDREVTDQLRNSQIGHSQSQSAGNVEDMAAIWLSGVKDQGTSVSIQGTALSPNAVATLISDLEATGYFKNIEIRETYREDKRNPQAFQFELTCEFEASNS